MAGPLCVATTAVSSAKVAVADCVEVVRSAVYSRYNSDPRTLLWSTTTLIGESLCVLSFNLYEEVSAMQIETINYANESRGTQI
jgi:hypothetical protein